MFIDQKVYLASSSSRRQDLLKQLQIMFTVVKPEVDERHIAGESATEYVRRLATSKARTARAIIDKEDMRNSAIIAADTCIVLDGEILGKPRNREHGVAMLKMLSGRAHHVYSAVSLVANGNEYIDHSVSMVHFCELSDRVIDAYWDSGEPHDKAGAYGIQGLAAGLIKRIEGSYTGIVGLPLYELIQLLKKSGLSKF